MKNINGSKDGSELNHLDYYQQRIKLSKIASSLEGTVLSALINHTEYLQRTNHLPFNENGQPMDQAQLATFVANHFSVIRKMWETGTPIRSIENTREYGDIVSWLAFAGIIRPNIAGDWQVDRARKAEDSLGLTSFDILEQITAKKYPLIHETDTHYRHLEMGPGNGKAMRLRKADGHKRNGSDRFEQYGIANAIYYPIEKVIKRFVHPQFRDEETDEINQTLDQFVELLGFALRLELKSLWFEAEGNVIGHWKHKVDAFNLNVIYRLLQNPKPWLKKWYDSRTGHYKVSQDFENEQEEKLDYTIHDLFLQLEGYSEQERIGILALAHLKPEREKFNRKIRALEDFNIKLEDNLDGHLRQVRMSLDELLEELKKIVEVQSFYPRTPRGLFQYVQSVERGYRKKRDYIKEVEKNLRSDGKKNNGDSPKQDFIGKIFNEEFVRAISDSYTTGPDQAFPDLNRSPSVFLDNFIVDDFQRVGEHFPKDSLFVVSGVRSLSHLPDKVYEKVLRMLLPLLKQGGYILDDGLRESYSRIYRFKIIQNILQDNPDLKAFIIVDRKTCEPKSVFIQRGHANGFLPEILTHEEKEQLLGSDLEFRSLDFVAYRPDLRALNAVRHKIMEAASDNVNHFKMLQGRVITQVYAQMQTELKKWPHQTPQGFRLKLPPNGTEAGNRENAEDENETLTMIKKGELFVPDEIVAKVTQRVSNEINYLLREFRVVHNHHEHFENPEVNTIYTLPPASPSEDVPGVLNRCYKFSANELPSNDIFATFGAERFLEARKEQIRQELNRLHFLGISSPIVIVSFLDCVTNDILADKIDEILGDGFSQSFVRKVGVRFDGPRPQGGSSVFSSQNVEAGLKDVIEKGGILIGGGSWHDSYVEWFYRTIIGKKLLRAVLEPQSRLRMLNICFSSQVWADVLGAEFWNGKIKTHPGMLEIGPTPINVLREGQKHPWFQGFPGFPQRFTVAATHSGHIYHDELSKKELRRVKNHQFIPLAESHITGMPMAWESCNGRVLAALFHPEVDLVEDGAISGDVKRIYEQLKNFRSRMKKNFNNDVDFAYRNFEHIINDSGEARVKANAGQFLLVNGLYTLLRSIH